MSNSISGFWLHLDQPRCFRLQTAHLCRLPGRTSFVWDRRPPRSYYDSVYPKASQQMFQSSAPADRLPFCALKLFSEASPTHAEAWADAMGRVAAGPRSTPRPRTGAVPTPAAGATPRRKPTGRARCGLAPGLLCGGESAAPRGNPFDKSQRLLHQGQPLVRPNAVVGCQPLGGLAGPDRHRCHPEVFVFDMICFESHPRCPSRRIVRLKCLDTLVMVYHFTRSHADIGRFLGQSSWPAPHSRPAPPVRPGWPQAIPGA